ncbi:MAG: dihydropteroate synthase [Muribaculaceae bacterium]|nr:dihydropteroate synthase [Muribaculaceae bacterium]
MKNSLNHTINLAGRLIDLSTPKVMGILNITPDSFYDGSRYLKEEDIEKRILQLINDGADFIDIGGCSTRPGSYSPSPEEEWSRISLGLKLLSAISPGFPASVDTFRSEITIKAVELYGPVIINDISGGNLDKKMWDTVAELKVPYVLSHMRGAPENMDSFCEYKDVVSEVITELSWKLNELFRKGVCDVIIDPGFGFAKTIDQNFKILAELQEFIKMDQPLLVGVSRKSMIYKTLGISPQDSLCGTVALDTVALMKGANILRVHDVKESVEIVKLVNIMNSV